MSAWVDSPNAVQRIVRRLIALRPMAWLLARTAHHLDRLFLGASGGRSMSSSGLTGLPIVNVTTIGAKSGQPRSVPLVGVPDGDRLIVIASNWGQAKHPAWYYNVRANPLVTVGHAGRAGRYVARETDGDERRACWDRAVAVYPGYAAYARRAGRDIPVIVLEPEGTAPVSDNAL